MKWFPLHGEYARELRTMDEMHKIHADGCEPTT
jgi:hypothetical protein